MEVQKSTAENALPKCHFDRQAADNLGGFGTALEFHEFTVLRKLFLVRKSISGRKLS